MKLFINPLDPDNIQIKKLLQQWLIQKLNLAENTEIEITEMSCNEPTCVHAETLFLVKSTTPPQYFKISKPLTYIRKWDLDTLKPINSPNFTHKH